MRRGAAVGVGKVADLVLLDGNPLADIRNTARVNAVMLRGILFDSAYLRGLLDGVARAAR